MIFLSIIAFLNCKYIVFKYDRIISQKSTEFNVDPALVKAIIFVESSFRADVISDKGAVGLMQIMPSTAAYICPGSVDLLNPEENIETGIKYLKYLFNRFTFTETVIAAYNAGEGNVSNWLKTEEFSRDGIKLESIPFKETEDYVSKVLFWKKIYSDVNAF